MDDEQTVEVTVQVVNSAAPEDFVVTLVEQLFVLLVDRHSDAKERVERIQIERHEDGRLKVDFFNKDGALLTTTTEQHAGAWKSWMKDTRQYPPTVQ